jgi:hypothetical protein
MWWALGVLVVIAVGFPLTIGLATRGLGRRPLKPLKPNPTVQWLQERYGLDGRASARVESAVAHGERVGDPALEDAANGLAALIVSNDAPGLRSLRMAGFGVMAGGTVLLIVAIIAVTLNILASHLQFFLVYGPLLMIQGGVQAILVPRIRRRKAAAALELNRQAAAARLSFRAGDHRAKGDARDSGDGGDRQRRG